MADEFRVLIVDDDLDTQDNFSDILEHYGFESESAGSIQTAIESLELRKISMIIVDWKLPDGSGGRILECPAVSDEKIPVVVVTGYADLEVAIQALRNGVYDFLTKPVSNESLINSVRKIHENWNIQQSLEAAKKKLVQHERLAAIGEMIAGVAHESRNIFQRCHSYIANLAPRVEADDIALSLVNELEVAVDEVGNLLNEIRDYAAPISIHWERHVARDVVECAWEKTILAASRSNAHATTIEFVLEDLAPEAQFCFDFSKVEQVLINLFTNAIEELTDVSKPEIRARISLAEKDTMIVEVIDNANTSAKTDLNRIFEPFFSDKPNGMGLGLAISRRIVEAHGGELRASKNNGRGCNFWFSIQP